MLGKIRAFVEPLLTFEHALHVVLIVALAVAAWLFVRRFARSASRRLDWIRSHATIVQTMVGKLTKPSVFLAVCVLSLIIFLLGAFAVLVVAMAFSQTVSLAGFLFVFPAIALVSALPISLGGWGVRESAMVVGLGVLHVFPEQAFSISLVYGLLGTVATILFGSFAYLLLLPHWNIFSPASTKTEKTQVVKVDGDELIVN